MMSAEQNAASSLSAAQIPSILEDQPLLNHGAISQSVDATGKVEEKKGPTVEQSWEKLMAEVAKYDSGMVKDWKEDIDTLLVFAGLFSAVVTAFVIESYQWLSEDPTDTTVAILVQISMQLNTSQSIIPERVQFEPDASSIRINCFWFLSLVFSLTSALFGLLCKQWLREHQRDPLTRTPAQALALRQLRRDSLERWGVSSFLSALPILLEVALLLFFVGVLDLLWNRQSRIPFAICSVAVILSAGSYLVTAFLPTLAIPRGDHWSKIIGGRFNELSYQFICPFKSPQAWAIYNLTRNAFRPLLEIHFFRRFLHKLPSLFSRIPWAASDWSALDLEVIEQFDLPGTASHPLNLYEVRALEWAVTIFRDNPSMIPHLETILGTVPPSLAISAVLGAWKQPIWRDIRKVDVNTRLRYLPSTQTANLFIMISPEPITRTPALLHPEGISLLFCHHSWMDMASGTNVSKGTIDHLVRSIDSQHANLQRSTGLQFVVPFPIVEKLWTHDDSDVREQSLQLTRFFKDAFSTYPSYNLDRRDGECFAFISVLAKHLNRIDRISCLSTSTCGQEYIRFINDYIISRRLQHPRSAWDAPEYERLMLESTRATRRVEEIGHLPPDYFAAIPGLNDPSLPVGTDIQLIGEPGYSFPTQTDPPPVPYDGTTTPRPQNSETDEDGGQPGIP
ncbi:hypothetical protein WG66_000277 [Moniliophthora roreri]|nr:hypothetical protein WG66_000277 [Moniliophthora roreri]